MFLPVSLCLIFCTVSKIAQSKTLVADDMHSFKELLGL